MESSTPVPMAAPRRVDLQNCAEEPIHIPGSIQPHGALIFLSDAGIVEGWSANIAAVTGSEPALGQPFAALGLPDAVTELIQECSATMDAGEARDVGMDEVAQFAIQAHSSIDRLRRQRTVDGLLETTVRQVRNFTGFDRVMAYRFRSDDSGDVVAEARRLHIAQQIVREHEGEIAYRHENGQVVFSVRLPLAPRQAS